MASDTALLRLPEARLTSVWRASAGVSVATVERPLDVSIPAEQIKAAPPVDLAPADLLIEIDRASGRFVNVLIDTQSHEVIRRYPSEQQLAFSRAVNAYVRAKTE